MFKRWIAIPIALFACTIPTGCEITVSAYVQQEYNTDPRVYSKPDGAARAEIKVTRNIGRKSGKGE